MKNIYSYHVRHRNGWGTGFGPRPTHCAQCGAEGGAGYGNEGSEPVNSHPDAPTLKKGESLERSRAICYACCATNDKRDMIETGRAALYLTHEDSPPRGFYLLGSHTSAGWYKTREEAEKALRPGLRIKPDVLRVYYASNWPGSLKLRIGGAVRHSQNNWGAHRVDVWFTGPDGRPWWGVNIGDNQILRCRRIKE
jgi:hypothetical protein